MLLLINDEPTLLSGTFGLVYCDFDIHEIVSAVTLRLISGLYPTEIGDDDNPFNWMSERSSSFDFIYRGKSPFHGTVEIPLNMPPCTENWKVKGSYNQNQFSDLVSNTQADTISFQKDPLPNESVNVVLQVESDGCKITTDPRTFWLSIGYPRLVKSK